MSGMLEQSDLPRVTRDAARHNRVLEDVASALLTQRGFVVYRCMVNSTGSVSAFVRKPRTFQTRLVKVSHSDIERELAQHL